MRKIAAVAVWALIFLLISGCSGIVKKSSLDASAPEKASFAEWGTVSSSNNNVCTVTPGSNYVYIYGYLLTPDAEFGYGGVMISPDGTISQVGKTTPEEIKGTNPTVVDCYPWGVISPGFINAHDHITYNQSFPGNWGDERYDHRSQWRYGLDGHTKIPYSPDKDPNKVAWSELRQIMSGTTSIAGSGGVAGLLRNLDDAKLLEGLPVDYAYYNVFPLGGSKDDMRSGDCKYSHIDDPNTVLTHQCYLPHVAEGVNLAANNEIRCMNLNNLVTSKGAFIHTVGAFGLDGELLHAKGTSVIWSPRSNISLYGNTAQVSMYAMQNINIALATDWTPSGSMNLLRELKCANSFNRDYLNGFFSDKALWTMVTANASDGLKLSGQIGRLKSTLIADIVVLNGTGMATPYRAVIDSDVDKVALVLRGGIPIYGDTNVMQYIPGGQAGCESIPGGVKGVPKTVCVKRETGQDFATLQKINVNSYGLFYDGNPPGEPTCTPFRKGQYTGIKTTDDLDGDGIPNKVDNCPNVFNPVRPMDNGKQADCNNNGIGDACDPKPCN